MKKINETTIEFISPISLETSMSSNFLGEKKSTMEFFPGKRYAEIEWIIEDGEIIEHIGLTFEGKVLVEYEGVFSLPTQAIQLIKLMGYLVPMDFE